jgi:hypothetical protein
LQSTIPSGPARLAEFAMRGNYNGPASLVKIGFFPVTIVSQTTYAKSQFPCEILGKPRLLGKNAPAVGQLTKWRAGGTPQPPRNSLGYRMLSSQGKLR